MNIDHVVKIKSIEQSDLEILIKRAKTKLDFVYGYAFYSGCLKYVDVFLEDSDGVWYVFSSIHDLDNRPLSGARQRYYRTHFSNDVAYSLVAIMNAYYRKGQITADDFFSNYRKLQTDFNAWESILMRVLPNKYKKQILKNYWKRITANRDMLKQSLYYRIATNKVL